MHHLLSGIYGDCLRGDKFWFATCVPLWRRKLVIIQTKSGHFAWRASKSDSPKIRIMLVAKDQAFHLEGKLELLSHGDGRLLSWRRARPRGGSDAAPEIFA
jgi:hypothetical protein